MAATGTERALIRVTRRTETGTPTATVTLPFELRQRSRLRARLDDAREAALLLERGTVLRGGDLLMSECGLCIQVVAEPEPVSAVRAADPESLARAAYHLGNRHVPLEVAAGELRYLADRVLDAMVAGLGARVEHAELPFEPEAGAYGHRHDHGDGHGHPPEHGQGDAHGHRHEHPHGEARCDGHGHGHGHGRGQDHGDRREPQPQHGPMRAHVHGSSHEHGNPHEDRPVHGHEGGGTRPGPRDTQGPENSKRREPGPASGAGP